MKEELLQLVNKYPNDAALGEMLRRYILCETDKFDVSVNESVDPEFKGFFNKVFEQTNTSINPNTQLPNQWDNSFNIIKVANKDEVLLVDWILKRLNVSVFKTPDIKEHFISKELNIKNEYLIKVEGGWVIQKNSLDEGISISELESKINEICK